MKVYLPLKKARDSPELEVGLKAKQISSLESSVKLPFSLVITSNVFEEFIKHNHLEEELSVFYAKNPDVCSLVQDFSRLSTSFKKADFPAHIKKELRECFELICIDTSSFNTLLPSLKEKSIMSLRRSTSYADGDSVCTGLLFTKDDFEEFLDRLKSCYVSAFAPSSISFRRKNKITDFSIGILLSKLPTLRGSFQSSISSDSSNIFVESYVGFPDTSKSVIRDTFTLSSAFLKILDSNIKEQNTVAVFDLATNRIEHKHYLTKGSSQSAPDQAMQEAARISKKIASITNNKEFKATIIGDKNNNLYLLDMLYTSDTKEETPLESESSNENTNENTQTTATQETALVEENNEVALPEDISLDIPMKDLFADDKTIKLVASIISFLRSRQQGDLLSSIDVIIRSLENELTAQTLGHALSLCKELVERSN